ncbi:hypothetical protein INR49_000825 [Caranx melampygus]|nr:hypothetical protein INR49_000825 [Caranx melampygus]
MNKFGPISNVTSLSPLQEVTSVHTSPPKRVMSSSLTHQTMDAAPEDAALCEYSWEFTKQ